MLYALGPDEPSNAGKESVEGLEGEGGMYESQLNVFLDWQTKINICTPTMLSAGNRKHTLVLFDLFHFCFSLQKIDLCSEYSWLSKMKKKKTENPMGVSFKSIHTPIPHLHACTETKLMYGWLMDSPLGQVYKPSSNRTVRHPHPSRSPPRPPVAHDPCAN